MRSIYLHIVAASILTGSVASAATQVEYDFTQYEEHALDGQQGWNIYPKIKDSSAIRLVDEVGMTEMVGDKALVILPAASTIRCVCGDSVRWMPGKTLNVEFDFKIAVPQDEPFSTRSVMSLFIGNSLLSERARWEVRLEALSNGDWQLAGSLPDSASKKIYAENFMLRLGEKVSVSDWFRLVLVIKKLETPDAFESQVEIKDVAGNTIAALKFTDTNKDRVTAAMWNLSRLHIGFGTAVDQYGLANIDNINVFVTE